MFELEDLRKTRVWQEAQEEGIAMGRKLEKVDLVRSCLAKGMPAKEVADLLGVTAQVIRKLAKEYPGNN